MTGAPMPAAGSVTRGRRVALGQGWFGRLAMLFLLLGLICLFSALKPETFATLDNARSILAENALVALVALGLMVPLVADEFDLSVAAMTGLASVLVAGLAAKQGIPFGANIALVLLAGLVVGVANAGLTVTAKLPSLVISIGTSSLLTGFTLGYTSGTVISSVPPALEDLGRQQLFGLQYQVYVMLLVAAALWVVLEHMPWGRFLYAIGANQEAAKLAGVPVARMKIMAFIAAALISTVAGVLLTARLGVGHPTTANGFLLPAFAAVYLGTAAFRVGFFNAWGTVLAVYLVAVGVTGLKLLGAPFWVDDVFNGAALIVGVGLSRFELRQIQRLRRRRAEAIAAQHDKGERS
jgi:ribose transport system permease protein